MKIEFEVPDDFVLPQWWTTLSHSSLTHVFTLIPSLVGCGEDGNVQQQVKALEDQLKGVNRAAEVAITAVEMRFESLYASKLKERDETVSHLQSQLADAKTLYNEAKETLRMMQEQYSAHLADLKQRNAVPTLTAQQMGRVAEEEVEQIIADTLVCEITNTSHTEGQGDRLVTTPGGLRLLQETKAVEKLHSKHDIEKFNKDVYEGVQSNRINAAILISLKTTSIPNNGPGPCSVTLVNNSKGPRTPVVLLSSSSKTSIQLAIHSIAQLQRIAAKEFEARGKTPVNEEMETYEREQGILQQHLPELCRYIHQTECGIETRIEMLETLLHAARSERSEQRDVHFMILKLQQQIPWLQKTDMSEAELAQDIVLRFYDKNEKWPKTSQLTVAQRQAVKNAGGMPKVLQEADAIVKKRKTES